MLAKKSTFIAFFWAWLCAFITATSLHSAFVQYKLTVLGVEIPWSLHLTMLGKDLSGLLPTYGVVIALSLIIGFSSINFISRRIPLIHSVRYPIAGMLSFLCMLLAMQPILDITLIAGARDSGFFGQLLAGAIAGWVFNKRLKE